MDSVKETIDRLRNEINNHNYNYYVCNNPTISDKEFDDLLAELQRLEDDPNHNPAPVIAKREEEIEEFIPSNNETTFRSFIDRFTNRSIAKRNKQKLDARVQEPITPSFSDDEDDKVNLEIPAFLRRK